MTKKHEGFKRNPKCDWCGSKPSVALILCTLHPVIGVSAISLCLDCEHDDFYLDGDTMKWRLVKK